MVGKLGRIAIAIGLISFFTFVSFFGRLPALRNTPIGALYRLIWIHTPRVLGRLDAHATGGRLTRGLSRTGTYLLHEKHPLVIVFFLGLISICSTVFLYSTVRYLNTIDILPLGILLPAPFIFTYLCASSKAIFIDTANHSQHMRTYPYDYVLYHPGNSCRTCHFDKPARSKHCSICRACVAKADHHCIWVNNCLGKDNHRWFLALLLSVGLLEMYGAWLAWKILSPRMSMDSRPEAETDSFWTRFINKIIEAVNIGGFSVTGVGLLAFLTAPLPLALLAYHIHLVWAGMTTNETVKWSDWREDMADGVVFKSKRTPVLGESGRLATDDKVSVEGDASNSHSPESRPNGAQRVDIGGVNVDWPITSDQIIVRTANGQPPGRNPDLWTRCWRLNEVNNLYDLGFWDNMKEVLNG